jgi:hypothetical protein
MKKVIHYTFALLLISLVGFSQERNTAVIDITTTFGDGFSPALSINKM